MWSSERIRNEFLRFFEDRGHVVVPSSSLVPAGDPTLLLTSAGMVQMKPYFMGEATPPGPRLTSCQKCFRTTDIESVGNERNLTFFEMLGNFSVGDYFKKDAVSFAWEFSTQRLGLPIDRIWITVYPDDEEARGLWLSLTPVPPERVVAQADNWWGPAGETGPCGPDSELYFDRGAHLGCGRLTCGPGCDCPRFLEFWNLVFMQFYQDQTGRRHPLDKKNIDTGAGLERLTMLLQDRASVYETDLFIPLLNTSGQLAGVKYGSDSKTDYSLRVLADHSRGITFLIGDGVLPSNEGRGYVLRRVLRRAIRHGRLLGIERAFLGDLVGCVIGLMKNQYPELEMRSDYILKVVELEEGRFNQTLATGLNLLDEIVSSVRSLGKLEIRGEDAFRLYDTFGFPKELTAEVASEQGLSVDWAGFDQAMAEQRKRAQDSHRFGLEGRISTDLYQKLGVQSVKFLGYYQLEATSEILGLLGGGMVIKEASAPEEVEAILAETPFYAESGGQVGDSGVLVGPTGSAEVLNTHRPLAGLIVHRARILEGRLSVGDIVTGTVDASRRQGTARHHTATHLLHSALREVLGSHVQQAGSLVAPDRLRFDFTHSAALAAEERARVQRRVNEMIMANLPVSPREMPYRQAIAAGAMALFGEKYGDVVRMVDVDSVSRELCGGTHVTRTGDIGFFIIIAESGIGAGQRRIEALAGLPAHEYFLGREALVEAVGERLESRDVLERVDQLLDELQEQRRQLSQLQRAAIAAEVDALWAKSDQVNGVRVVAARISSPSPEAMLEIGDLLRSRLGPSVIVLAAPIDGKPRFVAMVHNVPAVNAGTLMKDVSRAAGGSGGGTAEVARGGGRDIGRIEEALALVLPSVKKSLGA